VIDGRKIVVIEDDEAIRGLVATFLRAGGHTVVPSGDPVGARELIRREAPDLVLCDIAMPDLDGYGVLRALQNDPETAHYPVVFLTAHREFTERVEAFRFGVVDYITKPFTRDVLLRRVERLLLDLDRRPGVATGEGKAAAGRLLEDVHREARTGLLSVPGAQGEAHVAVLGGELKGGLPLPEEPTALRFEELDPSHEQIVAHEPSALPGDASGLPSFDDLAPEVKRALVVDDNPFFRRFLREIFQAQGFTVDDALNGAEALRLALERRPWLIVTDVDMPVMDGFELCRQVRRHSLIRHTPVVFLSGWDDFKVRCEGLEAGGDEYLSKQTPVRELLMRVRLLMRRFGDRERSPSGPGLSGSLDLVGVPGVLQMCHDGRLTGVLTAQSGTGIASVGFRRGEIVTADCGSASGEEAVFELLGWARGSFEFVPGEPEGGVPLGERFDQLLLEGCRRLDERRR
jgi:DNA-binding response OmpR family regulator